MTKMITAQKNIDDSYSTEDNDVNVSTPRTITKMITTARTVIMITTTDRAIATTIKANRTLMTAITAKRTVVLCHRHFFSSLS